MGTRFVCAAEASTCCLLHDGLGYTSTLKMEVVGFSETSTDFKLT